MVVSHVWQLSVVPPSKFRFQFSELANSLCTLIRLMPKTWRNTFKQARWYCKQQQTCLSNAGETGDIRQIMSKRKQPAINRTIVLLKIWWIHYTSRPESKTKTQFCKNSQNETRKRAMNYSKSRCCHPVEPRGRENPLSPFDKFVQIWRHSAFFSLVSIEIQINRFLR